MEQVLFGFALSGKPNVCSDWPTFAPVLTNQNIPLEACLSMVFAVDFICKGLLFEALFLLLCSILLCF